MITIPVSFGELIDKITILELKLQYIKESSKVINIKRELSLLNDSYHNYCQSYSTAITHQIYPIRCNLVEVNRRIWSIEDDIRKKEKLKEFDEKFIQLARSIYINNDKRAKLKRQLNEIVNSEVQEEKSYEKYE